MKRTMPYLFATLLALMCFAGSVLADIRGRVVGVTDGDTVTVLVNGHDQVKVRLAGIDAPERRQPFGQAAREALAQVIFQKDVEIIGDKIDRYGRMVGKIIYRDRDVNIELVRAGLAWWYRKYASEQSVQDRSTYAAAEDEARSGKRGLWSEPNPLPPWEWRSERRQRR